jgi:hypothetical protein
MHWYLVKLVFRVEAHTNSPQFDEQWRLIRADEAAWALEKATVIGRLEESNFLNYRQQPVAWKFIAVADIIRIGRFEDGAAIFSTTSEPAHAEQYIESVKMNARKSLALAHRQDSFANAGADDI